MDLCDICGDTKCSKFIQKLDCGHEFHYECILTTFRLDKYNTCPICRQVQDTLPIVNGLKKIYYGIHYYDEKPLLNNTLCNHILKSGKNKGNKCNKNCKLGYNVCGTHLKFVSTSTN